MLEIRLSSGSGKSNTPKMSRYFPVMMSKFKFLWPSSILSAMDARLKHIFVILQKVVAITSSCAAVPLLAGDSFFTTFVRGTNKGVPKSFVLLPQSMRLA
jgi:hypothetical protein